MAFRLFASHLPLVTVFQVRASYGNVFFFLSLCCLCFLEPQSPGPRSTYEVPLIKNKGIGRFFSCVRLLLTFKPAIRDLCQKCSPQKGRRAQVYADFDDYEVCVNLGSSTLLSAAFLTQVPNGRFKREKKANTRKKPPYTFILY